MKVDIAKHAGFCPGVKKAYKTALNQKEGTKILGQLVHNPDVSDELQEKGITEVESLDEIGDSETALIRAHGALTSELEEMKNREMEIVNCTCKKVQRIQRMAELFSKQGDRVAVFGKKGHPEFESICSHVDGEAIRISSPEDVESISDDIKNLTLLAQTTSKPEVYGEIKRLLKEKAVTLKAPNTLCPFTQDALVAAKQLATQVEAMIVIGGKNSSNTKNLVSACSEHIETFHVENEQDLADIDLSKINHVGITAGASTPETTVLRVAWVLEQV